MTDNELPRTEFLLRFYEKKERLKKEKKGKKKKRRERKKMKKKIFHSLKRKTTIYVIVFNNPVAISRKTLVKKFSFSFTGFSRNFQ